MIYLCFYTNDYGTRHWGEGLTAEAAYDDYNRRHGEDIKPDDCQFMKAEEVKVSVKYVWTVNDNIRQPSVEQLEGK